MKKKIAIGILLTLLLTSIATLAFNIQPIKAGTITVPDDYPTIQQAINAASQGDTIYVRTGTYYERVIVNKTVSIVGESKESTIIDGQKLWTPVNIQANNVVLEGFRIQNSAGTSMMGGVIVSANETIVRNNILITNLGEVGGIGLRNAYGNFINENIIMGCWRGITIWDSSNNNISGNIITNNSYGIYAINPVGNSIYHNDFINNTSYQVYLHPGSSGHSNIWDDGYPSGGNYWSNYTGVDEFSGTNQDEPGSDGIGDTPYVIDVNNTDKYPLMNPFNPILFPVPIYIKANGDVDPPIAPIQRVGDVYTFTGNITSVGDGIVVERDNITIDGAGYALQGLGSGSGITLNAGNVTIKNVRIRAFDEGIWLVGSSNNGIYGNSIANNRYGIGMYRYSNHNSIYENNITENGEYSIYLSWSSYNILYGNNIAIASNGAGIQLESSSYNNVYDNFVGVYDISHGWAWLGISLGSGNYPNSSSYNNIYNNTIKGILEIGGITLSGSSFNTIDSNTITDGNGIWLWDSAKNTIIQNNVNMTAPEGYWYRMVLDRSSENVIYHNNFVANKDQMYMYDSDNVWDNGYPSGGNYWSNYTGLDEFSGLNQDEPGSDGMGDTPYVIDANNTDRYPLIAPINTFYAGAWDGVSYNVDVTSNSTISDFHFNPEEGALLRFNVTGENGTSGFCRVTIPKSLLWVEDGWSILVGDQLITDYTMIQDGDYTYIYFTYSHSTKTVMIQGTHVIPEFPSAIILPLFMILSAIAVIFTKKKRKNKGATPKALFL